MYFEKALVVTLTTTLLELARDDVSHLLRLIKTTRCKIEDIIQTKMFSAILSNLYIFLRIYKMHMYDDIILSNITTKSLPCWYSVRSHTLCSTEYLKKHLSLCHVIQQQKWHTSCIKWIGCNTLGVINLIMQYSTTTLNEGKIRCCFNCKNWPSWFLSFLFFESDIKH